MTAACPFSSYYLQVSEAYQNATQLDPHNYKGWHAWALVNFHMVEQLTTAQASLLSSSRKSGRPGTGNSIATASGGGPIMATVPPYGRNNTVPASRMPLSDASLMSYNLAAAQGFLRAISLGQKRWSASVEQDMLCLLYVWFRYGNEPEVDRLLSSHFSIVNLDAWLGVLPQLIARIHTRESAVRCLLDDLLCRLGAKHPQALVYPLSVALKSPKIERKSAAEALMANLRQRSSSLVEQALLVSGELIRVAILWHEQWHEGLEEASRLYFGDGNVKSMLEVLIPLHEQLEQGPTTLREVAFQQAFGRELSQAYECIKRYREALAQTGHSPGPLVVPAYGRGGPHHHVGGEAEAALNQAWDLYYAVFKRINKQLPQLTTLDLQYVSPALLGSRNLELAVPGTYRVNGSAVRIANFNPAVQVSEARSF